LFVTASSRQFFFSFIYAPTANRGIVDSTVLAVKLKLQIHSVPKQNSKIQKEGISVHDFKFHSQEKLN
jgi:hypothetical protein